MLSRLHEILSKTFGYKSFRLDQQKIIESVLEGKDTLAIMPTGGGKSLCYQLPALYAEGVAVVISPLISLMQDQVASLNQNGVSAAYYNSTLNPAEKREIDERLARSEIRLLYIAPESALTETMLNRLKSLKISLFAIDEAHCVSQWGHEFRSDYRRLGELKRHFPDIVMIALTATADERTRQDIVEQLGFESPEVFISGFDRPNIRYQIYERRDELNQLHQFLQKNHKDDTGIIYCLSRSKVEKVAAKLTELGYRAIPYHAGLSSGVRQKHQKIFDSEDQVIVVATIAFGMGIDRPDVRFVAHLDLPKSIEGYYQETGRAGRDGEAASAWMVYGLGDVVKLAQMLETTEAGDAYKKVARSKLDAMLTLCETSDCRRKVLLDYFGDGADEACGNCDSCLNPPELRDATVDAQKILSAIYRTGQIFGAGHVIDVLRGSESSKVIDRDHHQLSVYGIGKDISKEGWNGILRQLLYLGYVRIKDWEYRSLGLTEKSRALLGGKETLKLRKMRMKEARAPKVRRSTTVDTSHGREELFQELRKARRILAEESSVPPYIVFSDRTLHEMCQFLPRDRSEMMMINGVGESKYEKYGERFLEVLRDWPAS